MRTPPATSGQLERLVEHHDADDHGDDGDQVRDERGPCGTELADHP